MTRESIINNERKHNVKTFFRLLAIITVIFVMMLAGCTKKLEELVATQPAVTTETQTESETTEVLTQETVTQLADYIESVHSEYMKNINEDNKNSGWFTFVWNYTTGTAELKSNDNKVQLKEDENLVLYIPGGIDRMVHHQGKIVEKIINYSNCVVFIFKEFSGEELLDITVEPENQQLESFDLRLTVVGNLEDVPQVHSTEQESLKEMNYSEWYSVKTNEVGLTFLWEGDKEKGYGKIINDGDRIHIGKNQKVIFSTMSGMYDFDILTPETASMQHFYGTDFEIEVIDIAEEFDVMLLVKDQKSGKKTGFKFTILPDSAKVLDSQKPADGLNYDEWLETGYVQAQLRKFEKGVLLFWNEEKGSGRILNSQDNVHMEDNEVLVYHTAEGRYSIVDDYPARGIENIAPFKQTEDFELSIAESGEEMTAISFMIVDALGEKGMGKTYHIFLVPEAAVPR